MCMSTRAVCGILSAVFEHGHVHRNISTFIKWKMDEQHCLLESALHAGNLLRRLAEGFLRLHYAGPSPKTLPLIHPFF